MVDEYLKIIADALHEHSEWLAQFCLVWALTWVANAVLQKLLCKFGTSTVSTSQNIRHAFVMAASAPLRIFIWVGGFTIALSIVQDNTSLPLLKTILKFQPVIHTLIIGWFALRFIRSSSHVVAHKYPLISVAQADTFQKIFSALIVLSMVMMTLPSFGISVSGLLAFGGIGGIVIGLAAKDMLANVFGAIMIYFDRPFALGDWVHLPEKDIQGTVEQIGWRQVVVRTFDKRLLFIPNSMFGNLIVMNPSKMTHRRIYEIIGVRYQDITKLPAIIEEIRTSLTQDSALDADAGIVVNLERFNAYSVDILVSAFTEHTDWAAFLAIKERVLFSINDIISKHNAEIAFPTQVLQIERSKLIPEERAHV